MKKTKLHRHVPCLFVGVLVLVAAMPISAQEGGDATEDFGQLVSPFTFEVGGLYRVLAAAPQNALLVGPSLADTEGSLVAGLIAGIKFVGGTQLKYGYSSLGLDDGSANLRIHALEGKHQFVVVPDTLVVSPAVQYRSVEDGAATTKALASIGYVVPGAGGRLQLAANVGSVWVSQASGSSADDVNDLYLGLGGAFGITREFTIAVDYVFDDETRDGGAFSVVALHSIASSGRLSFGYAQGGTVFVGYVATIGV